MIDGMHVDVPVAELRELIEARARYHDDRADKYERKARVLAKDSEDEKDEFSRRMPSVDPAEQIAEAIKRHRDRSAYCRFLAAHLAAEETYRLTESDLRGLGIGGLDDGRGF